MDYIAISSVSALVFFCAIGWIIYVHKTLLKETNQILNDEKKVSLRAEVYKTTSQLFAGIAVLASLFLTIGQLIETKIQYENTYRNQEQQILQQREDFSLKRFESAIIDLESKNASRRTSGVLTINSLANDFPTIYKKIADDVLIAFVRDSFSATFRRDTFNNGAVWPPRDRRLALEILSNRLDPDMKATTPFIKLDLSEANLPNIVINGLIFSDSNLDGANLSQSKLIGVDLRGSSLKKINFRGSDLSHSDFSIADIRSSDFMAATLKEASFVGADLRDSRFTAAMLSDASFRNANLSGSSFVGAIITNADLSGANLTGVEFLSQDDIDQARGDKFTILPKTLNRPSHWK